MEYSLNRVLEFKIDDDEIDTFLEVMEIVHSKSSRMGFKKHFNQEQQQFVDALHYSLIGQHEENTDKGDK